MYFMTIMLYLLWIAVVTLIAEHFCGIMEGQGTPCYKPRHTNSRSHAANQGTPIADLMLPTRLVTGYSVMAVSTDCHNG